MSVPLKGKPGLILVLLVLALFLLGGIILAVRLIISSETIQDSHRVNFWIGAIAALAVSSPLFIIIPRLLRGRTSRASSKLADRFYFAFLDQFENKEVNPTKRWPQIPKSDLLLNLNTCALNDIAVGDPYPKLRALGRPSNHHEIYQPPIASAFCEVFEYDPWDLQVDVRGGRIHEFHFEWGKASSREKKADFKLYVISKTGENYSIGGHSTSTDFVNLLGKDLPREREEQFTSMTYSVGSTLLNIEFYKDQLISMRMMKSDRRP